MRYGLMISSLFFSIVFVLATLAVSNAQSTSPIQITFKASTSGLTVTPTTVSAVDSAGASLSSVTVLWGDHQVTEWTASDGSLSTFFQPHTYSQAGPYTITIIADDSADNTQTATLQVSPVSSGSSSSASSPTPSSSSSSVIFLTLKVSTSGLTVTPTTVSATDNSGSSLTSVTVDWGDNSQSTWNAADGPLSTFFTAHTYAQSGTPTIKMSASDSADNSNTITQQVSVTAPGSSSSTSASSSSSPSSPISIVFKVSTSGLTVTPSTVSVVDNSGVALTSVTVAWGDGQQSSWTAADGSISTFFGAHTYSQSGSPTITVTATDSADNTQSATQKVSVSSPGSPTSSSSSSSSSVQPIQIALTTTNTMLTFTPTVIVTDPNSNSGATLTEVDLSWGDGSPDATWIANGYSMPSTFAGSHTYSAGAAYTITVTATDSANAQGTATKKITAGAIAPGSPSASSSSSPQSAIQSSFTTSISGLAVTPKININDLNINAGASLTSVTFSWGDGTPDTTWLANGSPLPSAFPYVHTYLTGGAFTLTLTVTDSAAASASSTSQIILTQSGSPSTSTQLTTPPVSTPAAPVTTTSQSSIGTSFVITPVSGVEVSGVVSVTDPNANSGAHLTSIQWSWGDGTSNSVWTASSGTGALSTFPGTHTYASASTYSISETVVDSANAKGSALQQVAVPSSSATSSPSSIIASTTVTSQGTTVTPSLNINDANINSGASLVSEQWSWGDGTADAVWSAAQSFSGQSASGASRQNILAPSQPQSPPSTFPGAHTYAVAGIYTISASATDSAGGSGTATQQVMASPDASAIASGQACNAALTACRENPPGNRNEPPGYVACPQTCTTSVSTATVSAPGPSTGGGFSSAAGATTVYSPVSAVNNSNSQSALWLLTCPNYYLTNPNIAQFFNSIGPNQFGGNQCASAPSSSSSSLSMIGDVNPSYYPAYTVASSSESSSQVALQTSLAGVSQSSSISGSALLNTNALGYTAEVDGAISDIFSKNQYIFQQSLSGNQHALWTWFSEIPQLLKTSISFSTPSQTSPSTGLVSTYQTQLPYSYAVTTSSGSDTCTYTTTSETNYPTSDYLGTTAVSGFTNTYLPYAPANHAPFPVALFPYLTYQISIPALYNQALQLSYYIFSPSKYLTPANNLDALPISIGGNFFVSYQGYLAIAAQNSINSQSQWSSPKESVTAPATVAQYDAEYVKNQNSQFCTPPTPTPGTISQYPDAASYSDSAYCQYCSNNPGSSDCSGYSYSQYLNDCTGPTYCTSYASGVTNIDGIDTSGCQSLSPLNPTPAYCQASPQGPLTISNFQIPSPVSIVSLPTDYTYVLSFNSVSQTYNVYVLRTVPLGRYDVGAPTSMAPAPTQSAWNVEWDQYWQEVTNAQNDNTYLVSTIPVGSGFTPINMSVDYAGDIFLTGTQNNAPAISLVPSSTSTTSGFIEPIKTTSATSSSTDMMMPEIAASPTGQYVFLANQSDGGYVYEYQTSTLQADSQQQGGSAASPTSEINLAYQGPNPSSIQSTSTSAVSMNTIAWLENSGPYGQQQGWISDYLGTYSAAQQPAAGSDFDSAAYHHPLGIQDVNGYLYILDNWAGGLDVAQQGSCSVFGQCNYNGVFFSMLTVRAVNSIGLSVPISPSFENDLYQTGTCSLTAPTPGSSTPQSVPQGQCTSLTPSCSPTPPCSTIVTQCPATAQNPKLAQNSYSCSAGGSQSNSQSYTSLATPGSYASTIYPPYGWIISGNITAVQLQDLPFFVIGTPYYGLGNTGSSPSLYKSVTFCDSTSCTYNPQNLASAYNYQGTFEPIGPQVTALNMSLINDPLGNKVPRAVSSSLPIQAKWAPVYSNIGFSVGFNESLSLLFSGQQTKSSGDGGYYTITTANPNTYNDLIFTAMNIQNYTKLFDGSAQFSCYTDNALQVYPLSDCDKNVLVNSAPAPLAAVANMRAPLYNMPDPLAFTEALGGSQQPTFPESIESSYPASSASQSSLTNCAQSVSSTGEGGSCSGSSASGAVQTASGLLNGPTPAPTQLVPVQQSITLSVNGVVILPYAYSYSTTQSWNNFAGGTCTATSCSICNPGGTHCSTSSCGTNLRASAPQVLSPPSPTGGTFYTEVVSPEFSNTITTNINGGATYLQDLLNNYYQQNLSDIGVALSPSIAYNIQSNRQIGDSLVNITTNLLHGGSGAQYILNATHQLDYQITTYSQGGQIGYETIGSLPTTPPQNGVAAAVNVLSNTQPSSQGFVNQNYLGANTQISLNSGGSAVANLFDFYISEAYSASHSLIMTNTLLQGTSASAPSTYQALGYNRLLYMLRDTFNNTFTAPIDADISQPSTVALSVTPTVDQVNANKTTLAISGTLTYTTNGNVQPIANNQIYLYYDQNINFANYNPKSSSSQLTAAQLCAFGSGPESSTSAAACQIANPLSPTPNTQSPDELTNSQVVTFATSYNALGDCNPPPQALLTPTTYNCNINGLDGLSATCPTTFANGQSRPQQYCLAQTSDGSGVCTSQMGLIGIVTTGSDGSFSYPQSGSPALTVCGIGTAQVLASYYGFAGPEPTTVTQTSLTLSASPQVTCSSPNVNCQSTTVNNYYYAPAHSIASVPIGLFELSYGDIGIAVLLVAIASAMLALLSKRR